MTANNPGSVKIVLRDARRQGEAIQVSSPHHAGWMSKVTVGSVVVLALALAIADAIRQSHVKGVQNPNDFVTLYAGAICMTHACNPYSVPDLDKVLVNVRGSSITQDWSDQLPIYPPTTIVLLLPLSLLSYKSATILWYSLSLAIYVFGIPEEDRKSTRLNSSHANISYAVFC